MRHFQGTQSTHIETITYLATFEMFFFPLFFNSLQSALNSKEISAKVRPLIYLFTNMLQSTKSDISSQQLYCCVPKKWEV